MKNLAKFFVAVAALFVGVSCATDTTEDLGQQIVGKGQTVLTVSTGESVLDTKTSLGDKVDGTYPIYWSNGDQLSLNGVASAPLADVAANATTATFKWEGTFDAPFCVAYPASAEGTVTFAAEQEYVEGTFSQNAVPMIGYADEAGVSGVQLQYLAGVLQFNVSGAATLASMIIETVDGTPIAGVFDCDFATGTVKPQAGSRSSIEYSFGEEGLNISGGKSFHVAVPAGKYDAVKVIMLDAEGGAFEGTVKADGTVKPELAAGQVREFTISNWTANKTYFVIKDAQTLDQFATAVEETPALEAVVLKNVDASSLTDWAPIEGFTGLLRGNGKTISGLTKPLFGELKGTVSNLILNSTIVTGDSTDGSTNIYGTFAKKLIGSASTVTEGEGEDAVEKTVVDAPAQLLNCVSNGTFQVKNTTFTNKTTLGTFAFGGLVGQAEYAIIKGCTNNMSILSTQYAASSATRGTPIYGGVVGYVKLNTKVENCANTGAIDWNDVSRNKENDYAPCFKMGGVVGYAAEGEIKNCQNSGAITVKKTTRQIDLGGIVGYTAVDVTDCENTGKMWIKSYARYMNGFGGCVGRVSKANLTRLINRGTVEVSGASFSKLLVGGVVGKGESTPYVGSCHNYGPIVIAGSSQEGVDAQYCQKFVGGIAGQVDGVVSTNTNHETGTIDLSFGGILYKNSKTTSTPFLCIGGVVGVKSSSGNTNNKNFANITFAPANALTVSARHAEGGANAANVGTINPLIGGCCGYASSAPIGCKNSGDITVSGVMDSGLYVGGIVANSVSDSKFYNATNSGDINVSAVLNDDVYLGGVQALMDNRSQESATNNNEGDITFSGTARLAYLGGIYGYKAQYGTTTLEDATVDECHNTGVITLAADAKVMGYCVGGVGGFSAAIMTGCTNDGAINVLPNQVKPVLSADGLLHLPVKVGGIAGVARGKLYSCENKANGDITVSGDIYPSVNTQTTFGLGKEAVATDGTDGYSYSNCAIKNNGNAVGGILGTCSGANLCGCVNRGDVNVSADIVPFAEADGYTISNSLYTGGLIGYSSNGQDGTTSRGANENHGAITVSGDYNNMTSYIAGAIARVSSSNHKNCDNYGSITVNSTNIKALYVAGVIAQISAATYSGCDNEGDITIGSGVTLSDVCIVGGIVPAFNVSLILSNCHNTGHIAVNANNTPGNLVVGGVAGYMDKVTADKEQIVNCSNGGNVSITGTNLASAFIGGITGSQGSQAMVGTDLTNEGTISFSGSAKKAYVGGIAGSITQSVSAWTGVKNTGAVNVTGSLTATGDFMVGGLVGRAKGVKTGWEVDATVSAPAAATCGIVMGTARSYGAASGCYVKGKVTRGGAAEVTLAADNFADYVYSTAADFVEGDATFGSKPAEE